MHLLDPTYIRDKVDYSFGDESGHRLFNGYMRTANQSNLEFLTKYQSHDKPYMTLFCDNIRLYRREGIRYTANEEVNPEWARLKDDKVRRLQNEDLLALCKSLPDLDFIIFCHFEDTPIDEYVFDCIPHNVKAIYASNTMAYSAKVRPMPYGLQRRLSKSDNRQEILLSMLDEQITPNKLLYCNYNVNNNPRRPLINKNLSNKDWVTIRNPFPDYRQYLTEIKQHKFVLCPSGNAKGCECHRDWETLYMRRVPVVERSDYLEYIFKDFPVLFVDNFMNVTEQMLKDNEHLLNEAANLDFSKLDIKLIYESIIAKHEAEYR